MSTENKNLIIPVSIADLGFIKIYQNKVKWNDVCYNGENINTNIFSSSIFKDLGIKQIGEPPQNIAVTNFEIIHLTNSFNKAKLTLTYMYDANYDADFLDKILSGILNKGSRMISLYYGDSNANEYHSESFMMTTFSLSHKYNSVSYNIDLVTASGYLDATSTSHNSKCVHIPQLNNLPLASALRMIFECGLKKVDQLKSLNKILFYFPDESDAKKDENNFENWDNVVDISYVQVGNVFKEVESKNINLRLFGKKITKNYTTFEYAPKEALMYCKGLEETFKKGNNLYNWWYWGNGNPNATKRTNLNDDEKDYANIESYDDELRPAIKTDIATELCNNETRPEIYIECGGDLFEYGIVLHKAESKKNVVSEYNEFLKKQYKKHYSDKVVDKFAKIYANYVTNIETINQGRNIDNSGYVKCNLVYFDDFYGYDSKNKKFYPVLLLKSEEGTLDQPVVFEYENDKYKIFPYNSQDIYYEPGLYYVTDDLEYHMLVPAYLYKVKNSDIYNYHAGKFIKDENLVTTVNSCLGISTGTKKKIIDFLDSHTINKDSHNYTKKGCEYYGSYEKLCKKSAEENFYKSTHIKFSEINQNDDDPVSYSVCYGNGNVNYGYLNIQEKYKSLYNFSYLNYTKDNNYDAIVRYGQDISFNESKVRLYYKYNFTIVNGYSISNCDTTNSTIQFIGPNNELKDYYITGIIDNWNDVYSVKDSKLTGKYEIYSDIDKTFYLDNKSYEDFTKLTNGEGFSRISPNIYVTIKSVEKLLVNKNDKSGIIGYGQNDDGSYYIIVSYDCGNYYWKLNNKANPWILDMTRSRFKIEFDYNDGISDYIKTTKFSFRCYEHDHSKLKNGVNIIRLYNANDNVVTTVENVTVMYLVVLDNNIFISIRERLGVSNPGICVPFLQITYQYPKYKFSSQVKLNDQLSNVNENMLSNDKEFDLLNQIITKNNNNNTIVSVYKDGIAKYKTDAVYDVNLFFDNCGELLKFVSSGNSKKLTLDCNSSRLGTNLKRSISSTKMWNKYFTGINATYGTNQQKSITLESMDVQPGKLIDLIKDRITDYRGGIYYYKWVTNKVSTDNSTSVDNLVFYRVNAPIEKDEVSSYEKLCENSPVFIIGTGNSNVLSYGISDYSSFLYTTHNSTNKIINNSDGITISKTSSNNGDNINNSSQEDENSTERFNAWSDAMSKNGLINVDLTVPLRFDLKLGQYIKIIFYLGNDQTPHWQSGYYVITKVVTKIGTTNNTSLSAQKLHSI